MQDIHITFKNLNKGKTNGMVWQDQDGFTIVINNQLDKDGQIKVILHEILHCYHDFKEDNPIQDVQELEYLNRIRLKKYMNLDN